MFRRESKTYPLPYGYTMRYTETFADDGRKIADYWEKIYDGKVINATNGTHIHKGNLYRDGQLIFAYDASKHGAVADVVIRLDEMRHSIATLIFAFNNIDHIDIDWCSCIERDAFEYGINGYTKIHDIRYDSNYEKFMAGFNARHEEMHKTMDSILGSINKTNKTLDERSAEFDKRQAEINAMLDELNDL